VGKAAKWVKMNRHIERATRKIYPSSQKKVLPLEAEIIEI
jgi:hypothetical protein